MRDEGYKRCRVCGEVRPRSEFYRHTGASDGLRGDCKACNRETSRRWRGENPEQQREQGRRKYAKIRAERPETHRDRIRRWRDANLAYANEMTRANLAIFRAIRRGQIVRPDVCSKCGAGGPIEAHHPDHAKPLDVEWLCRICHRAADARRRT